nr:MAG TPA: hypothetical protein [Caudoviricetes sp.]
MGIKCCKDCIAPKRHAGCHATCAEYLSEKKAHDELREKERKWREAANSLYAQRSKGVQRALRSRRK